MTPAPSAPQLWAAAKAAGACPCDACAVRRLRVMEAYYADVVLGATAANLEVSE